MAALVDRDLLRRHVRGERGRRDHAGRDRVAADAALAVLRRDVARQRVERGLRGAVGGAHRIADQRRGRRGVDDRRRRRARACAGSRACSRACGPRRLTAKVRSSTATSSAGDVEVAARAARARRRRRCCAARRARRRRVTAAATIAATDASSATSVVLGVARPPAPRSRGDARGAVAIHVGDDHRWRPRPPAPARWRGRCPRPRP